MVKKKVSLGQSAAEGERPYDFKPSAVEVLELFFNTGIVFHDVILPGGLPDVVSSFVVMQEGAAGGSAAGSVRRAQPGEDPDVEVSATDHLAELGGRWIPVPYQLSCPFAVQAFVAEVGGGAIHVVLAIDTLERSGSQGRHLDAALDEGRPFRALDKNETAAFFDVPEVRELVTKLERSGTDKAIFKLAALLEAIAPSLPKIRLARVETTPAIPVSLVVDLGNSRSTALLVEGRDASVFGVPLEVRSLGSPTKTSAETFDSRLTFLPSPWDRTVSAVATGDSFQWPSVARMGKEALDRALETPHRYQCTISGPKRYLWDHRLTDERWHFAQKIGQAGEYRPIGGRILKYLPEESGGTYLREDGPQTPADPRYAPRTMMLFALVEILCQAYAQINGAQYRTFQGKEQNPRVLRHLVLTYPSAMREEERAVYEALARNAIVLACHVLNVRPELRPSWNAAANQFDRILFTDEALAAQMVFVFQECKGTFGGSMEEFIGVYGHEGRLRVASVDIGGGTSDVMIAEYEDKLPGAGTSLAIKKLFQDGVGIAGDEVCRAIIEDVIFPQILAQLVSAESRSRFLHLFAEGDAGHGSAWRTLRARLVPYLWLPLARCYWAVAEGKILPDHAPDKMVLLTYVFEIFGLSSISPALVSEADRFLTGEVPDFPGIENLFLKFDAREVERAIERVLREPLRRYADILAQFDVDLLVLAGRTASLPCIHALFTREMPVSPPRIKSMAKYRVGEWYPSKWKDRGNVKDAKSTVTAGAAVLHLASQNKLAGFLIDGIAEADQKPIYGLYQDVEPHISRDNELFRASASGRDASPPFVYTNGMRLGFRNVDSEAMDGSPLFEIRPATADVENALLEDRVAIQFGRARDGSITIAQVTSQKNTYSFEPSDFVLSLKTSTSDKYWLDTGVFTGVFEASRR